MYKREIVFWPKVQSAISVTFNVLTPSIRRNEANLMLAMTANSRKMHLFVGSYEQRKR